MNTQGLVQILIFFKEFFFLLPNFLNLKRLFRDPVYGSVTQFERRSFELICFVFSFFLSTESSSCRWAVNLYHHEIPMALAKKCFPNFPNILFFSVFFVFFFFLFVLPSFFLFFFFYFPFLLEDRTSPVKLLHEQNIQCHDRRPRRGGQPDCWAHTPQEARQLCL